MILMYPVKNVFFSDSYNSVVVWVCWSCCFIIYYIGA